MNESKVNRALSWALVENEDLSKNDTVQLHDGGESMGI